MTQHDPKLVDELLAKIDDLNMLTGAPDEQNLNAVPFYILKSISKAREALRQAPPKPREWWIGFNDHAKAIAYITKEYAEEQTRQMPLIQVREVMPNDDRPRVWLPEWKDLNLSGFGFYYADGRIMFEEMYNQIRKKLMSLDK